MKDFLEDDIKNAIINRFSKSKFFNFMQFNIVDLEKGKAVLSLKTRQELLQTAGILDGGVTAALCDAAVAVALLTAIAPDSNIVTIDLKINYLKAVKEGEIFACAEIIQLGKSIAVSEITVFDKNGNNYAVALSTYAIKK